MIPVFEPDVGDEEAIAAAEAVRRGEISGTFGRTIQQFEEEFAAFVGTRHAVAVTSGTTALQLAVAVAGIKAGDEVLVSASTNIATGLAVLHNGAVPIPIDSESDTWNLDLDLIESQITPRTRAIIPVHLFGHPVDMDKLRCIADRHQLVVIEDAAEAHGATVRGRRVGGMGDMACFSFYANKIITTGEGGMVTTNDDSVVESLRLLRNLGFTMPRFRHEVAGYNFRMTGIQAAIGRVQLRKIDRILDRKRCVAALYSKHLRDIPGLQLPREANWAKHVYWMYGVRVESTSGTTRNELAAHLYKEGIDTRTFFCPMNLQPCFSHLQACRTVECPVAEALWEDGLYLPSGTCLSETDIERVTTAIRSGILHRRGRFPT